jgi:hypothetical protein
MELSDIQRAERVALGFLSANGLLLCSSTVTADFYDVLIKQQLRRVDRTNYDQIVNALSASELTVVVKGQDEPVVDAACDAYTPLIDGAYHLGLAMGFEVAKLIGGGR